MKELYELCLEEPISCLAQLVEALDAGRVSVTSTRAALERVLRGNSGTVERAYAALRAWGRDEKENSRTESLSAVLGALKCVRERMEDRGPSCELVWTGPTETATAVRATRVVVDEMLATASRTVLFVAYAVWIGDEGDTARIVARLAALRRDGVAVTFILDAGYLHGWSIAQIKRRWPANTPRPRLFSWADERDEIAKMHAKVLLVDDRDLLSTSANLTGHGLAANLEFGLRVRGTPAAQAAQHFTALIVSGLLSRVEWA